MLCLFRDAYGQVYTTFVMTGELADPKRRAVFQHFGHWIKPGAEMIDSTQDAANRVATVAFHDRKNKELVVVLVKGGEGEAAVKLDLKGVTAPGHCWLTDETANFADRGEVAA